MNDKEQMGLRVVEAARRGRMRRDDDGLPNNADFDRYGVGTSARLSIGLRQRNKMAHAAQILHRMATELELAGRDYENIPNDVMCAIRCDGIVTQARRELGALFGIREGRPPSSVDK